MKGIFDADVPILSHLNNYCILSAGGETDDQSKIRFQVSFYFKWGHKIIHDI
jgi:hypothetical protein